MSRERPKPVDLAQVKTYSVRQRRSKLDVGLLAKVPDVHAPLLEFFETLPPLLKARELLVACQRLAEAHMKQRGVVVLLGAHVIKAGLSPIIVKMIEERLITSVAMTGAAAFHDFEMATLGQTSEDVESALESGMLGMAQETPEMMNKIIADGVKFGRGLGESLGRGVRHMMPRYERVSVLAAAQRIGIPLTVHVAIGTDTLHQHASSSGEALGKGTMHDFRVLAGLLPAINGGGAVLNIGSAVVLPEVFLNALNVARNVTGPIKDFAAINLDMVQHYRPTQSVVNRPTKTGGTPISLIGHHEIMVPLLYAGIKSFLKEYR